MAIINCRICGKRISNKAKSCSHCGAVFSADGSVENLESAQMIQKMKKSSRIQTISFISIIVFVIGILLWYFEVNLTAYFNKNLGMNLQFGKEVQSVAKYVLALGFVGYVAARFMIYFNKKK